MARYIDICRESNAHNMWFYFMCLAIVYVPPKHMVTCIAFYSMKDIIHVNVPEWYIPLKHAIQNQSTLFKMFCYDPYSSPELLWTVNELYQQFRCLSYLVNSLDISITAWSQSQRIAVVLPSSMLWNFLNTKRNGGGKVLQYWARWLLLVSSLCIVYDYKHWLGVYLWIFFVLYGWVSLIFKVKYM